MSDDHGEVDLLKPNSIDSVQLSERNAVELEIRRLEAHCIEILINHGLAATKTEKLWQYPESAGNKVIWKYSYIREEFIQAGRDVAARDDVSESEKLAGKAASIIGDDLLPAILKNELTWKLMSWTLLLTALIPDPGAETDKSERLAEKISKDEPDTQLGRTDRLGRVKGGLAKGEKYEVWWDKCQKLANCFWHTNPNLTKSDVAKKICRTYSNLNPDTVRRKINKPKKVGKY